MMHQDSRGGRVFSSTLESSLTGLGIIVDRVAGASDISNVFGMNKSDVILYSGSVSYDYIAHQETTWWRPYNTWKDGSIAIPWMVSTDGRTLRSPSFVQINADTQNVEAGNLNVYLWPMQGYSTPYNPALYTTHWLGLHAADGTTLGSAYFDSAEQIAVPGVATQTVPIAKIPLSQINWPQDHKTYLAVHFPDDDPLHAGENITLYPSSSGATTIYDARSTGITYGGEATQCLSAELIREGCSATTGNVAEPWADSCAEPHNIFPSYTSGRTWAESAYVGFKHLSWMEVAIGDPLMAPFAGNPSVSLVTPSPADSRHIAGLVSLYATAAPYGSGTLQRVDFWVTSSQSCIKIGTDYQAPYECTWDTLEMSGENRVYPDGSYTIEAVAYQEGSIVGKSTATRSVVVDNATVPAVSISQPETDDSVVTDSAPVQAQPGGTPTKVEFWLFSEDEPILAGQATSAPYQCTISSSTAQDGVYDLQAVAYYDATTSTSYSSKRRIALVNDSTPVTSVSGLGSLASGTSVYLVNVSVTAGVSSAMDGAFYVEDSSRATGIRVETTDTTITQGTRVTVSGTLYKTGTGVIERHITASKVWGSGNTTCPQPLGLPNLHVGGQAPAGTVGATGGVGLYNTGLLVRVWGRVKYVGDNYVYIEDGSNLQDGNTREGAIIVPLDGGTIPTTHPSVTGVRVYCGTLTKPGIGDYVSITGISSTAQLAPEEPIIRCIRLRSQVDVTYVDSYARCAKKQYSQQSWDGYFVDINQNTIPVGSKVRMVNAMVEKRFTDYLRVRHYDYDISHFFTNMWIPSYISATTLLNAYQSITITGASFTSGTDQWILADRIYLGGSAYGAMGAMSVGLDSFSVASEGISASTIQEETPERGGGPFRPWPYPTAEEILASPAFQTAYNQPGNIGWVLSQPDGSVLDLRAEAICGDWYDGQVIGLREWFEPIPNGPSLLLYLDAPAKLDIAYRDMATIDIIGGTLVTLSDGRRAIMKPDAVYVYTDSEGRWTPPLPWPKTTGMNGVTDGSDNWPWKTKIVP